MQACSQDIDISYETVAKILDVSRTSISNWVKDGELISPRHGYVTTDSFIHFKNQIAGKTRLIARANKLHQSPTFPSRPAKQTQQDHDTSSLTYESALGNTLQNKEGVYYTAPHIVDTLLSKIKGDVSNLTFFDPCCGTGNFLLGAIRRGFNPQNIYGQDCDTKALSIAKTRLEATTKTKFKNLNCADFLNPSIPAHTQQYDIIATNPPWGKKYSHTEKMIYANRFGLSSPIGSSALFSLQAFDSLKNGGRMALLLPEACFNIAIFAPLRNRFLKFDILALENHGRVFPGLITAAHSIICCKTEKVMRSNIVCTTSSQTYTRTQESFARQPKSIFNFHACPEDMNIITHIFNTPHMTLKNNAKWGLGIVTGSNKTLCRDAPLTHDVAVYKGSDISKTGLKPPSHYINPDLSRYRQTAPQALYRAREKLIYKFISTRLVFFKDTQQRLILNSANMMVLNEGFPLSHTQLSFLLNTDIMNFVFQKTFATRKILKSDLETLPIFHEFFQHNPTLTETALLAYLGVAIEKDGYKITR